MTEVENRHEIWDTLVGCVCDELRDGTLAYDDAVEDLLMLGFGADEARDLLSPIVRRLPKVARPA